MLCLVRFLFVEYMDMCKKGMEMTMAEEFEVLCGANSYEQKYYFNEKYEKLPKSIQEELHIICVLFTEEVGGVFTMSFDGEGDLLFKSEADEADYYYDDISAGLLIRKIQSTRSELLDSISMYYKALNGKLDLNDLSED